VIVRPVLTLDWPGMAPLRLDPSTTPLRAELAPALGGATAWDQISTIDLELLPDEFRLQRVVFKAAQKAHAHLREHFSGTPEFLAFQLIRLIEQFLDSDKLDIP